jgi:hypothetical protein
LSVLKSKYRRTFGQKDGYGNRLDLSEPNIHFLLLAGQFSMLTSLNFWVRKKPASTAEIDYVYLFESQLIPIEVKSGKDGTLRSLHQFMDEAPHKLAVRFYAGKLQITTANTSAGNSYHLLNLPYYLASQTEKYIGLLKGGVKT